MATGDVTIWTGNASTGNVYFQPSAGVQMALKCCQGTYLSTTNYLTLENQGGYSIRGSNISYLYRGALGSEWGGGAQDQVEWLGTQLMTNANYVAIDGTGASSKTYYLAGIQTDA